MESPSPEETLKRRVKAAGKFRDEAYYNLYTTYTDVAIQVHSIVETQNGTCVLRGWRGQSFGPKNLEEKRETYLFRVDKNNFRRYLAPPDRKIGKAIERFGKRWLLEMEVYDEHRESLMGVRSGDYVAIENLHVAKISAKNSLIIHSGSIHNRGISVVPIDYDDSKFQALRKRIDEKLSIIKNFENFQEFQKLEEAESNVQFATQEILNTALQEATQKGDFTVLEYATQESEFDYPPCKNIRIGDQILVDFFPNNSKCKYHFLTHPHQFSGLDKGWKHKIFCSEDTAKILPFLMGYKNAKEVPPNRIIPLKTDFPFDLDDFQVCLVETRFCPGSVMFVFDGPYINRSSGGPIMVTGPFRADEKFIDSLAGRNNWIRMGRYSNIYLDNTYFHSKIQFPSREESMKSVIEAIQGNPMKSIYIPLDPVGHELLLDEISRYLVRTIQIYDEKRIIMEALGFNCDRGLGKKNSKIEVVKKSDFDRNVPLNSVIIDLIPESNTYYFQGNTAKIAYSNHSSRKEIFEFLKNLEFGRIIPISRGCSEADIIAMMSPREYSTSSAKRARF